ncbi:MAG: FtsK/SpoIIIE domain-containing protein [Gulosibacter sp.]|uniref:FtsK/SpoIIIE domain-containing protein n=1 Tax=Gulosibacter sp. TaxID=2817531 RepID=UPI003F8E6928
MTLIVEAPADREEPAIRLPSIPEEPAPNGFPVLMVVAPVVVALILFAILKTPYVLMFAVLGPVLGTANVIDQRIGRRRRRRRAEADFEVQAVLATAEINAAHRRLIARKRALLPLARDLIAGAVRVEQGIAVGVATVASGLRTEGTGSDERSRALAQFAGRLAGAPVSVECRSIAVTGPRAEVSGAVRALVVQLLTEDPAAPIALTGDLSAAVAGELRMAGVELSSVHEAEVVIGANTDPRVSGADDWEQDYEASIRIGVGGASVLTAPDGRMTRIDVDSLSAGLLSAWLPRVVAAQRARVRAASIVPSSCDLVDLPAAPPGGIGAVFMVGADGAVTLDLVTDGPHAVVGGTTGSGKSELLIAWAAALASSHTSEECNFLCVDFKGGATFDAIAELPHCVGVVTDLDEDEAVRVVSSMRAEVRKREQQLRDLGVRDIAALMPGVMPRLVVMVDEYQALLEAHPGLQEVFGDLGARGRSLGIHLILCTQRPTGTFRENLLANCAIRVCLRVEQPSDSATLLGAPDGAHLDRGLRGRALVRIGSGEIRTVQVALARPQIVAELATREEARRSAEHRGAVARPWHPSLPLELRTEQLQLATIPGGIPFGMGDLPERQLQPVVGIDRPGEHIFVVGMAESGKSGMIDAVAEGAAQRSIPVVRIGPEIEAAWDRVEHLLRGPSPVWRVVLIDDIDLIEQHLDEEHRSEWLDRVQRLLRSATQLRLSVIITARRVSGSLQKLRSLCGATLFLAAPSRQEWVLQGADPGDWTESLPPGRGRLGRMLVQITKASPGNDLDSQVAHQQWQSFRVPKEGLLVTGRRLGPVREALTALGHSVGGVPNAAAMRTGDLAVEIGGQVILGDTDQWNASYGTLPKLAERVPVLAIGMTPGEWRGIFRGDPIYPALADPFARGLLRHPSGKVDRVALHEGAPVQLQAQVNHSSRGAELHFTSGVQ